MGDSGRECLDPVKPLPRRTKATIVAGLALAALTVCAWLVHLVRDPRDVPAGQPPLVRVDAATFAEVREQFNAAGSTTRIVALFSPT